MTRPVVLAVDDVPDNLGTLSEMLGALDVSVRVASNGATALRYAALEPRPDLILLDVMMPGLDGHAVLAELRARPETQNIPVIFVTALDRPEDEEIGLQEGAVDYITKPIKPAVLRARVRAQLELKHARDRQASQQAWLIKEVNRRVAENARLENRLQMALAVTGYGIWEINQQTGSCEWNDSLCRIFGLDAAPPTIAAALDLVHPDDRQALEAHLTDSLVESGEVYLDELRMQHRDGHWIWMEIRGKAISRDDRGAPLVVVGTMTDISRRKLADAEHRLASVVFTGISDGICITDPQGRILMTNEAFYRVTGYSASEAQGQKPSLLKSGMHSPAVLASLR